MAKTVFDKILDTVTGPKSYNWYKNEVSKITTPGARALINRGKATIRPKFGLNPIDVRFVKKYINIRKELKNAVSNFSKEVKRKKFPLKKHSY